MSILMKILGGGKKEQDQAMRQCIDCLVEFEDAQNFSRAANQMCKSVLDAVADNLLELPGGETAQYRSRLEALKGKVSRILPEAVLTAIREDLDAILKSYGEALRFSQDARERQLRESAAALADLAESVASTDHEGKASLQTLAKQLREQASTAGLVDLNRKLHNEAERVRNDPEDSSADSKAVLDRLGA